MTNNAPAQTDYHSRINHDLLSRIPPSAHTILEVGCGSGALGRAFKAKHPECIWIGIEALHEPAKQAQQVLDQVICADVEEADSELNGLPAFDCLIYGDVLEHLRNPWKCLQRHVQMLNPEGLVLVCVPNVQHWSAIVSLLQGHWPLMNEGLFDRTHLRWFTRSGLVQMLEEAGLEIRELQPRIFDPKPAQALVAHLAPALPSLGVTETALLQGVAPLQYVAVARRRPPTR